MLRQVEAARFADEHATRHTYRMAVDNGGRSLSGTFTRGNTFSRGRPRDSITAALRRQADPDVIAAYLLSVITDDDASSKDRLRAVEIVTDRLEGKSIGRSVVMRTTAASILPPHYFELGTDAQLRVIDDLRERAVRGELDAGDDTNDEGTDDDDTEAQ